MSNFVLLDGMSIQGAKNMSNSQLKTIGRRMKELRESKELSQDEVAKEARTTRRIINQLENHRYHNPGWMLIIRICNALNVGLDELIK